MSWSELGTIVASFIISLGGGGAIVLGLSKWIGQMFADRYLERAKHEIQQEVESYKTKLKKSEFLFQKEFEAASQFISLHHSLLPRYLYPDMDWGDACIDFARNFSEVEKKLEQYKATHGAVLQEDALDHLTKAIRKASANKFEEVSSLSPHIIQLIQLAEETMDELEKVEKELRKAIWSQSST